MCNRHQQMNPSGWIVHLDNSLINVSHPKEVHIRNQLVFGKPKNSNYSPGYVL